MIGMVKGTTRQMKQVAGLPAPIASFRTNMSGNIDSLKVLVEAVQSGSGTPSPDNVRPITGWSGANVTRTGANVWDEEWESGYWNVTTGLPVVNADYIRCKNFLSVKPNTTYCLANSSTTSVNNEVLFFDIDKNLLNPSYTDVKGNATFTTPTNCYFIKFYMNINYGRTYNNDVSINYPSTDTAYHAYNGNTYTIAFGDTYYGGELDVTNGVLRVTHGYIEFDGTENWINVGGSYPFAFQIDTGISNKIDNPISAQGITTNLFPQATTDVPTSNAIRWQVGGSTGRLFVYDYTHSGDLAGFKQMLTTNGLQVMYKLATPIEIQLTPIQIAQLLGDNNVFADCGDVSVCVYQNRIVTKLFSKG